jgi:hypothetical protein
MNENGADVFPQRTFPYDGAVTLGVRSLASHLIILPLISLSRSSVG